MASLENVRKRLSQLQLVPPDGFTPTPPAPWDGEHHVRDWVEWDPTTGQWTTHVWNPATMGPWDAIVMKIDAIEDARMGVAGDWTHGKSLEQLMREFATLTGRQYGTGDSDE